MPDAKVTRLSAEHGWLDVGPESHDLKIGDKIELIVGYADFTTVLHDEFYVFRGNRLGSRLADRGPRHAAVAGPAQIHA